MKFSIYLIILIFIPYNIIKTQQITIQNYDKIALKTNCYDQNNCSNTLCL